MAQDAASSASHNFPINLAIKPLDLGEDAVENDEQGKWITEYGIAGRVWEAVPYLMQYLNPAGVNKISFEPPCSIFARKPCLKAKEPLRILELGSGNGHLCLHHLAPLLPPGSLLVLTDLEEVMPLLSANVQIALKEGRIPSQVEVRVEPLPWGSQNHLDKLRTRPACDYFTHVVCSDLVYFTHLLEPLLRTLLWLTEDEGAHDTNNTRQAEIIFGYKIRTIHKEQPFWETLGAFFELEAVYQNMPAASSDDEDDDEENSFIDPFLEERLLIMLASRKKGSVWNPKPEAVKPLMDYKDDQFERMLMLRSIG